MVMVSETLGDPSGRKFSDDDIKCVQSALAGLLGIQMPGKWPSQYWADAVEAIARRAEDPDLVLADWIKNGFRLRIESLIAYTGVFPPVMADSAATIALQLSSSPSLWL